MQLIILFFSFYSYIFLFFGLIFAALSFFLPFFLLSVFLFISDYLDDMSTVNKDDPQDQFFLTAADPKDGKPEERLNEVINAKYQAGFLKPYNYVNGYARLQRYMEHQ